MATEELYSTAITNIRAHTNNDTRIAGATVKECVATFEVGAKDVGSIYRVCRLPAHARIKKIKYYCDAMTGGPIDIGLYPINSSTALDDDCYANNAVVTAALTTGEQNRRFHTLDIDKIENKLWQDAGVATEPIRGTLYDLCVTTSTAVTVGGTLSMSVEYVDGN